MLVLRLDAYGTPTIEPPYPPIRLSRLSAGGQELSLDPEDLVVAGAPVMPGFVAPQITRVSGVFPSGRGTVVASGSWGYTEPDGTPDGRTPLAIRRATMLLVMRMLQPIAHADPLDDARMRSRIRQIRTRDQSVTFAEPERGVEVTDDTQLDEVLRLYRRPFGIGAA